MGRWITVRVVAWGLRRGVADDVIEQAIRRRFRHRDTAWRWEVIGDAHLLNDRAQIRQDYKTWKAGTR
jgi:hypothetical protein